MNVVNNKQPYTDFREYLDRALKVCKASDNLYYNNITNKFNAENSLIVINKIIEIRKEYFKNTLNAKQTMYKMYEFLNKSYMDNLHENNSYDDDFIKQTRTGITETYLKVLTYIKKYDIIKEYMKNKQEY